MTTKTHNDQSQLRTIAKPSRSTGTSASSRKNRLQRCSACGGLGHKSRTCAEQANYRAMAGRVKHPGLIYAHQLAHHGMGANGPPHSQAALCLLSLADDEKTPSASSMSSQLGVRYEAGSLVNRIYTSMPPLAPGSLPPQMPSPPPTMLGMHMMTPQSVAMSGYPQYAPQSPAPAGATPYYFTSAMQALPSQYMNTSPTAPPTAPLLHSRMLFSHGNYGQPQRMHPALSNAQAQQRLVYVSQPQLVSA